MLGWLRRPSLERNVRRRQVPAVCGLACLLVAGCTISPPDSLDLERCTAPGARIDPVGAVAGALRVATINMWGIPYVSQHIGARFDALAERLRADASIDVVGLQEVWDQSARTRLLEAVRDIFPHQIDFHGEHGRSGLALLSRHPFVGAPRFHAFTDSGKWWKPWNGEWFGGKGAGAARITRGDGTATWVAVTHLHSCYAAGAPLACDDDEFAAVRQSQLEELRGFVNDLAGGEPAIVLGDFNFTPTSHAFATLQSPRPTSLFDPGWLPVAEPHAPPTRIDHIWLRPGRADVLRKLEPARVVYEEPVALEAGRAVALSDHCAIAATIGLAPAR